MVTKSFENWVSKTGTPFDLLADDVKWTIAGSSAQAKTYTNKRQLLTQVLDPLNQRLSKRIMPDAKGIYADGDMVIVLWRSIVETSAGKPHNGDYAWFMQFENGKITKVTAFLDNQKFAEAMALPTNK
ncbi:nuclear transport factor 2 family protein [Pedobacter antarcticus]|uniref:nuclear transport factor 2 family protein n=1 Tax=Pedobacter antarcticus TaxID=34086 RepID=UPI00292F3FA2|nr:nuclear transport factor 2 family protein [Pedobacter antarcticus]